MEIVLNNQYLLYEILDKLDFHDIYFLKNVNKTFKEVVGQQYSRKLCKLYNSACICIIMLKTKSFFMKPIVVQEQRRKALEDLMFKYWVVLINNKNLINCFNYLLEENKNSHIYQQHFLEKKKVKIKYKFMEKYLKLDLLENI